MKARVIIVGLMLLALIVMAQPLTVTITPSTVAPGGIVTVSVKGQAGETCAIEIRDPLGGLAFVKEITLPAGEGSASWTVPLEARAGTYTVYVSCKVSGAVSATLRVTPLVGGEARKDLSPLMMTALTALAVGTIVAAIVKVMPDKILLLK